MKKNTEPVCLWRNAFASEDFLSVCSATVTVQVYISRSCLEESNNYYSEFWEGCSMLQNSLPTLFAKQFKWLKAKRNKKKETQRIKI